VALAAALITLLLVAGSVVAWWWHDRTALTRDVEAALGEAAEHQNAERWPEARAALARATGRLGNAGPAHLAERIRQARADAVMVAQLDELRLHLSEGAVDASSTRADQYYADAFTTYGIPLTTLDPDVAADQVRQSSIRETLRAFLHDWLYWAPPTDRDRIQAVLDRADDSPWRRAFRESLAGKDGAKMRELARQPDAQAQSPVIITCLADALSRAGQPEEEVTLLREAQGRHPLDFWINYLLGLFLWQSHPEEALSYSRVATAMRPTSGLAHAMVGNCLLANRDVEGALEAFRIAQTLDPDRELGLDLATALESRSWLAEAQAVWEKHLQNHPADFGAWFGYAELCLYLGKEKAYRSARRELLERFGETREPLVAERVARACFLLRPSDDELPRALALVNRAMAGHSDYLHPYVQFAQGLAEYRQGHLERAMTLLQQSAATLSIPSPRLALALAQYRRGLKQEARASLEAAIRNYDWKALETWRVDWWVCQVLRREAEATIRPDGATPR
jgi:serine/threonine-protein kinase